MENIIGQGSPVTQYDKDFLDSESYTMLSKSIGDLQYEIYKLKKSVKVLSRDMIIATDYIEYLKTTK